MHVNRFDTAAAEWDQKQRRVDLAAAIAAGIAALPAPPGDWRRWSTAAAPASSVSPSPPAWAR